MSRHANLRLNAKLLPIIAPLMAKQDIRYYLNGINVRPHKDGGAIITATNGHALGAIHDRLAVCEHEVILRLDARMLQACAGRATDREVVMLSGRLAVIEASGVEVYIQAENPEIEGNFPRYERVIPKVEQLRPGLLGTYGAAVLAPAEKAALAAAKLHSLRYNGLQFFNVDGNADACCVFRLPVEPNFVGVLMPMRADIFKSATPAWVSELHKADEAATSAARSAA